MRRMTTSRAFAAAAAAGVLALCASPALARDVKRCGVTIGAGKTGTLVQDVECGYRCSGDSTVRCVFEREDYRCPVDRGQWCVPETILLERNATLFLNGFKLRGAYGQTVVECAPSRQGRCTIEGPGRLEAPKGRPVRANDQDVTLKSLTVFGPYDAIETAGWVRLEDFTMQQCDASIIGGKGVRVRNARFSASCYLYSRGNLYVDGIDAVDGFTAEGDVRAKDVVVREGGIAGKNVALKGAQVPAPPRDWLPNRPDVLAKKRLVLRDATVGGIESGVKPVLRGASCLRSTKTGTADTWGVCDGE